MTLSNDPRRLPIDEAYAQWAATYDTQPNPMTTMCAIVLRDWWRETKGHTLLELGCGTGRNLHSALRAGCNRALGVDRSPEMLDIARRRCPEAEFIAADVSRPVPLPDACATRLLMCLVLEHVADVRPVLGEARRLLRAGGEIRVVEVHPDRLAAGSRATFRTASGEEVVTEVHIHSEVELRLAAEASGLHVEACRSWSPSDTEAKRHPPLRGKAGRPLLISCTLR